MIHRIAIIVGSTTAAVILVLGAIAGGFGPTPAADADQLDLPVSTGIDAPSPSAITQEETRTVYVRPAPPPKVIHVTRRLPSPTDRPAGHDGSKRAEHHHDDGEHGGDD